MIVRVLAFICGVALVVYTFLSALRTFVLPRSASEMLTRFVFRTTRQLFNLAMKALPSCAQRDRLMAVYAPLCLLLLVPVWLTLTTLGYTLIFWSMGVTPWARAFLFSGSSILTLGFETADNLAQTIVAFTEATVGLMLVAMLISYLPTMYSAFSRRETAVSLLEVRAGNPPTAPELIWRLHGLGRQINVAGWRVNYDSVLRALARLTMAPAQTWLSDVTFVLVDPDSGRTGGDLRKVET